MSDTPWRTASTKVSSRVLDLDELKAVLIGLEPDMLNVGGTGISFASFKTRLPPTEPIEVHLSGLWETATKVFERSRMSSRV